ncbi:MAG TPA: PD-(D/E)XK nuclease family transposase [Candidatus Wallbacteria bacterium]|nr:PD-(D/E)XK nuclease family transposase [Candidatus Wallbacteria bacterium]
MCDNQTKLFAGQLESGDNYAALTKTIGISITDFVMFDELSELHNIYRLWNIECKHELTDILELHYIELPKFDKEKPCLEMTITAYRKAISKDEVHEMIEFMHKARLDEATRLHDAGMDGKLEGKIEAAKSFLNPECQSLKLLKFSE